MNYLQTDAQTISDLSILERPGKASVFDLFNNTKTLGGSSRLAQLFREPLADEDEINRRSALYRFFSLEEYVFPIDTVTIGSVEYYMQNDDVRSQLRPENETITQRLRNIVAADANHVFVENGVQSSLRLFYQLEIFLKGLEVRVQGSPYERQYCMLVQLMNDDSLSGFRQHICSKHEAKLNNFTLAALDKQIRFDFREMILRLMDLLYDLDVYITVGLVARRKGFHFAKALTGDNNIVQFKQVYHPLLENAIANDLELNTEHNILFLTGANMAGKSTLMKSVGIALYLGHMGFPVPAAQLEFSVRDGIYTSINLADNLNAGASHFYTEVLRVKEVAVSLNEGKKLFVIFDELFRGTNVKDAFDGTISITRAFTKKTGSQFIISTHIMEAGELLSEEPLSIQYYYLPTEMKGNMPVYTRVLKEGITDDRQGMIIIQNEGILEMLDTAIEKKESALCIS